MSRESAILAGLLVLACVLPASAAAPKAVPRQVLRPAYDVSTTPEELRPAYAPQGWDTGDFIFYPALKAGLSYDDNIFAAPHKTGDWLTTLHPILKVLSNWKRNALDFTAEIIGTFHAKIHSEDTVDWATALNGRLDVMRNTQAGVDLAYAERTESRGAATAIGNAADPTRYSDFDAGLWVEQRFNAMFTRLQATLNRLVYDPADLVGGGTASNRDRNRRVWGGEIRTGYDISPDTSVYLRASYNRVDYDLRPPAVAFDRNSQGYEVGLGGDFRIMRPLHGSVFVGYRQQFYAQPVPDISAPAYHIALDWDVTTITSLTLSADSTIEETDYAGASGILDRNIGLGVTHYLYRDLRLSADGHAVWDDFNDSNRSDHGWDLNIAAQYLMDRNFTFSLAYSLQRRNSSDAAFRFTRNIVTANVSAQF